MVKCEVIADRVSLVARKGSIVLVDERQFEVAKRFLKPVKEKQEAEEKPKKNSE